jgi:hypothetical protein
MFPPSQINLLQDYYYYYYCQLTRTRWHAFSRGLRPFVLMFFLLKSITAVPCSGGVKIAHFTQEATTRCTLSYSCLLRFKILSVRFGNCWSPSSCSVYQRLCIVIFVRHIKILPVLDVNQLLILFVGTVTYLKPVTFSSIFFYINFCVCVNIVLSRHNMT